MAFNVLAALEKKPRRRPASKEIPTAFLHTQHSTLSQVFVKETRIAYKESRVVPNFCKDKMEVARTGEVEPDPQSGSFRDEYAQPPPKDCIGSPELNYSSYPGLDPLTVHFSHCTSIRTSAIFIGSHVLICLDQSDEPAAHPISFASSCSWISFEYITTLSSHTSFNSGSDALSPTVSWVSFKFADSHESCSADSSDSTASIAEVIEKATICAGGLKEAGGIIVAYMEASLSSTSTESQSASLPRCTSWVSFKIAESRETSMTISIESSTPVEALGELVQVMTPPYTIKKAQVAARNSYTQYVLGESKKMALSMLSDTPYTMAEGTRVAKARTAEEADDEMAHPVLPACRKQVSAYVDALENSSFRLESDGRGEEVKISAVATHIPERGTSPSAVRFDINEANSVFELPVASTVEISHQGRYKK
ncbi:hypothetical protein HWV62_14570 [Athelia sp. TMB]|nr:hypothetical protein HWV62_14570 [Athelia sp. TMB]